MTNQVYYRIDAFKYGEGDLWFGEKKHRPTVPGTDHTLGLTLYTVPIERRTPKGVFIYGKFINNEWRKKFAYPTKEEAVQGFLMRKRREVEILSSRLAHAKVALQLIEANDYEDQKEIVLNDFGV